jgi:hypothetical protein
MQAYGSLGLVVRGREMLGVVVSIVGTARFPMDTELALSDTVTDPIEAHVDGFGASLFDFVIDDAFGHCIVSFDGCCRLGPTQLI